MHCEDKDGYQKVLLQNVLFVWTSFPVVNDNNNNIFV